MPICSSPPVASQGKWPKFDDHHRKNRMRRVPFLPTSAEKTNRTRASFALASLPFVVFLPHQPIRLCDALFLGLLRWVFTSPLVFSFRLSSGGTEFGFVVFGQKRRKIVDYCRNNRRRLIVQATCSVMLRFVCFLSCWDGPPLPSVFNSHTHRGRFPTDWLKNNSTPSITRSSACREDWCAFFLAHCSCPCTSWRHQPPTSGLHNNLTPCSTGEI